MTTVSGIPFWESSPASYGTITLGKHTIRGVKDVQVKRARKRDKKSAPGTNGAKLGNKGFEAASVKIEWHVCTDEGDSPSQRWDEAATILADLEDRKRAEDALAIDHPFCAIRGITSVTVDSIEGPKVVESSGLFAFTLDCTEYTMPEAKKVGGRGGAGGGKVAGAGDTFPATYAFPGDPKVLEGQLIEGPEGTYREAKSGKRVTLLAIFATPDNPNMLTPIPLAREKAFNKALKDAAGTKGTGTFEDLSDTSDKDVGEIAFVEDDDGAVRGTTQAYKDAQAAESQAQPGDLDP